MEKARHKKNQKIRFKFSILSVLHGYMATSLRFVALGSRCPGIIFFRPCRVSMDLIKVNVALPNGRSEHFALPKSSKVGDLRILAQKAFGQGFLRLVSDKGVMLDPEESLEFSRTWRSSHSCCTSTKVGGSKRLFCLVVLWRQYRDHLG